MNKEKIINCLKSNVKKFNRWRLLYGITELNLENASLENANLNYARLENANLYNANLDNAMLERITGKLILSVNGIGSRTSTTIYNYTDDQIQCGCFFGIFQQWLKKIKKTYTRDNRHYQEYKRAACYLFWQARYMASMEAV